jgi:NADH-quinone oxidoreductase subunit F
VLDTHLTYEDLAALGSVLGSASVIILDEDTDMVWAALKMIEFFRHESCGKCTPCREGTYWLEKRMEAIYHKTATSADVTLIEDVAKQMQGKCLCALGDFATSPVLSSLKYWRDEYLKYVAPAAPAKAVKGAPGTTQARAAAPVPAGD